MSQIKRILSILLCLGLLLLSACKSGSKTISAPTENSSSSVERPYVVLVSLDGFRWDYVERFHPPFLHKFIENGVKASSLIPSFPTKTFPNHYTIATGMYPDKHGLLGNSFYSHKKDKTYRIGKREFVEDGSFYNGTPLWVLAAKSGMVSASYFFVGSEANIQGIWPTYYKKYDASIKNEERVSQVLDWLSLPDAQRPHLITMYFSDMDDVGHSFGPNADDELEPVLMALDLNLRKLYEGIQATGLPVDLIIVSDHGMAEVTKERYIPIEPIVNDSLYTVVDNGAIVNLHLKDPNNLENILADLRQKENHFKVYKTTETPGFEYVPKNPDWGEIQVVPNFGYYFAKREKIDKVISKSKTSFGVHGYDPAHKEMHGIFYAQGPSFKSGLEIASFKNIHIYPLVCKILGLPVPKDIDGNLTAVQEVLK